MFGSNSGTKGGGAEIGHRRLNSTDRLYSTPGHSSTYSSDALSRCDDGDTSGGDGRLERALQHEEEIVSEPLLSAYALAAASSASGVALEKKGAEKVVQEKEPGEDNLHKRKGDQRARRRRSRRGSHGGSHGGSDRRRGVTSPGMSSGASTGEFLDSLDPGSASRYFYRSNRREEEEAAEAEAEQVEKHQKQQKQLLEVEEAEEEEEQRMVQAVLAAQVLDQVDQGESGKDGTAKTASREHNIMGVTASSGMVPGGSPSRPGTGSNKKSTPPITPPRFPRPPSHRRLGSDLSRVNTATSALAVSNHGSTNSIHTPQTPQASVDNSSYLTNSQFGWSTGTGSSEDDEDDAYGDGDPLDTSTRSESLVSWDEDVHGKLPDEHKKLLEQRHQQQQHITYQHKPLPSPPSSATSRKFPMGMGSQSGDGTTATSITPRAVGRSSNTNRWLSQLGVDVTADGMGSISDDWFSSTRANQNQNERNKGEEQPKEEVEEDGTPRQSGMRRTRDDVLFTGGAKLSIPSMATPTLMQLQTLGDSDSQSGLFSAGDGGEDSSYQYSRSDRPQSAVHQSLLEEEDSRERSCEEASSSERSELERNDYGRARPDQMGERQLSLQRLEEFAEREENRQQQLEAAGTFPADCNDNRRSSGVSSLNRSPSSVSQGLDEDSKGSAGQIDEGLRERLGLGRPSSLLSNLREKAMIKEEKEYDPFDLGSATTDNSNERQGIRPPNRRWSQKRGDEDRNSSSWSSSNSSSSGSSSGSFTSASSTEPSFPTDFVVAKPDWEKGSIAESSIKSLTADLRAAVQEDAIKARAMPEKLPVYNVSNRVPPPIQEEVSSPRAQKKAVEKVRDPFDLASSTGSVDQQHRAKRQSSEWISGSVSLGSSGSNSSSESGSYTTGTSSEDTPPARMVVTNDNTGSVAESSIKSVLAQMQEKDEAGGKARPVKLPVYRSSPSKAGSGGNVSSENDGLLLGWSRDASDKSSNEGGDHFTSWPSSPEKLRRWQPKPKAKIDPIEKGWVIVCVKNLVSPEKAAAVEDYARKLSSPNSNASSSSGEGGSESSSSSSSESDAVRKELKYREKINPNIVHEEQKAVRNLSAMWEVKASTKPKDPAQDAAVAQSRSRAHDRMLVFRQRRSGATTLQSAWRRYLARKALVDRFRAAETAEHDKKTIALATLQIQQFWRSKRDRRVYAHQKEAACTLQSRYRGSMQRRQYRNILASCILIQSMARGRATRSEANVEDEAAMIIQRTWLGHSDRRRFLWQKYAACLLQAQYRGLMERRRYTEILFSCVALQALARGTVVRRQQAVEKAATKIQACWRSRSVQREYSKQNDSVTKIQALARGGSAKLAFKRQRALLRGVIALQSISRGNRQRSMLSLQSSAASLIQRKYRCFKVDEATKSQRDAAAISIQSLVRRSGTLKRYRHSITSCIIVQSMIRRRQCRSRFKNMIKSTIVIQGLARGARARKEYRGVKENHQCQCDSAEQIQGMWRTRQAKKEFQKKQSSSITIQTNFRGRSGRSHFCETVRRVVVIQALARGARTRDEYKATKATAARERDAVKLLQKVWRGHSKQEHFLKARWACILIQSAVRRGRSQRNFRALITGCVAIQALSRGKNARNRHSEETQAATVLQGWWRRLIISTETANETAAAIISAHWRSYAARKQYVQMKGSSICLQSNARSFILRQQYLQQRDATIAIQAAHRGATERTKFRRTQALIGAAVIHEAISARKIQYAWRHHSRQRRYFEEMHAASTIQCAWRNSMSRAEVARKRHSAATVLQKYHRAACATTKLKKTRSSATLIQSHARGYAERSRFARHIHLVRGCVAMQSLTRGAIDRRRLEAQQNAACVVQRAWRSRMNRLEAKRSQKERIDAATTLQAAYRSSSSSKSYQGKRRSIIIIQSACRMLQMKRHRQHRANHKDLTLIVACTKIQAIARSSLVRKHVSQSIAATRIQQRWRHHYLATERLDSKEEGGRDQMGPLKKDKAILAAMVAGFGSGAAVAAAAAVPTRSTHETRDCVGAGQILESRAALESNHFARSTAQELTRYNSVAISSGGESSSLSQYVRVSSASHTPRDVRKYATSASSSEDTYNDEASAASSEEDHGYDEDRIKAALAIDPGETLDSLAVSLLPSSLNDDASDKSISASSMGNLLAGKQRGSVETVSSLSSHLSEYFADDEPPATSKAVDQSLDQNDPILGISPLKQTYDSVSSESDQSPSSSDTGSDGNGARALFSSPSGLPPVVEGSIEGSSASSDDDYDIEANDSPPRVDERRLDCVVPSSRARQASVRARTERLAARPTLSASVLGSSSNLSSYLQDEESGKTAPPGAAGIDSNSSDGNTSDENWRASEAGQSSVQLEDKKPKGMSERGVPSHAPAVAPYAGSVHASRGTESDNEHSTSSDNMAALAAATTAATIVTGITVAAGAHAGNGIDYDDDVEMRRATAAAELQFAENEYEETNREALHGKDPDKGCNASDKDIATKEADQEVAEYDEEHGPHTESGRFDDVDDGQYDKCIDYDDEYGDDCEEYYSDEGYYAEENGEDYDDLDELEAGTRSTQKRWLPLRSRNRKPISRNRLWAYLCCAFLVLALLVVTIVLVTVLIGGKTTSGAAGLSSSTGSQAPSTSPTMDARDTPEPAPPLDPESFERYEAVIEALGSFTDPNDLMSTRSAQHKAATWIASTDQIPIDSPYLIQRFTLATLYFSTEGHNWSECRAAAAENGREAGHCSSERARFLSQESECDWHGIECSDDGFVTAVDLIRMNLDGELPAELGSLSQLERLYLPKNKLRSTIPSKLGTLGNLKELDLYSNDLIGLIPSELGNLPLEIIHLSTNALSGSLPNIFNDKLVHFDVAVNELDGNLPSNLFDATSLEELNLADNNFSGSLSDSFENLSSLKKLLLWLNKFTGTVPASIGELDKLQVLQLAYNKLSGSMPQEVCELYDLASFNGDSLRTLSSDCHSSASGAPAKVECSCCTLCLEGY